MTYLQIGPQRDWCHHLQQNNLSVCSVGYILIAMFICRVPREAVHAVPTTFLLSLEGMSGLDWKMLRKLQCPDGSFMSSPAPTAYALMQTGDPKCFEFLDRVVSKFNGSGTKSNKMIT